MQVDQDGVVRQGGVCSSNSKLRHINDDLPAESKTAKSVVALYFEPESGTSPLQELSTRILKNCSRQY